MRVQQLIQDDLNTCSAKHANKSTLVARGADTQLDPSCVSASLATNVDLWDPIIELHEQRLCIDKHANRTNPLVVN